MPVHLQLCHGKVSNTSQTHVGFTNSSSTKMGAGSGLTLQERLDGIAKRISSQEFLENKGLGNEVGIHVFAYDPHYEWQVRAAVANLMHASVTGKLPCCIHERNLWEAVLEVCRQKRILDKIDALEHKRGSKALQKSLQPIVTPEALVLA